MHYVAPGTLDARPIGSRRSGGWVFVLGVGPWSALGQALYATGETPCPGCGRMRDDPPRLGWGRYCLQCDGIDPRCAPPEASAGEPIDNRPNWTYIQVYGLDRRAYEPDPRGLRGGRA